MDQIELFGIGREGLSTKLHIQIAHDLVQQIVVGHEVLGVLHTLHIDLEVVLHQLRNDIVFAADLTDKVRH